MNTVLPPLRRCFASSQQRSLRLPVLLLALVATVTIAQAQTSDIPRQSWLVHSVDSQETTGESAPATNVFDGSSATFWASQWYAAKPALPHEIQINLGATYEVSGFRYLPRQDKVNGRIGQYEFYVSTDGVTWGAAAATGTFPAGTAEQRITFTARSGRYVRLRALTDQSGTNYRTSVAELNVLQTVAGNQAPNGTISAPAGNVTVAVGGSVNFTGSGSDPDANTPLTYRWTFGTGSGIADSTAQNPGAVTFSNPGTFTVSFTVTDSLGLADPTPATRTVTVEAGTGSVIPQGNWSLAYVDSQETSGENAGAVRAFDGNPATYWASQWSAAKPTLPHEIRINLGAAYDVSGFRYLPRQDKVNGRIGQYEFYVSADGSTWGTAVATGTFPAGTTEQQITFAPKNGRYVRLRALTDQSGTNYRTSLAELNVLGTATSPTNQAPNGTIDAPSGDVTIAVGGSVNFTATAADPDGNTPLTYVWNFGTGSGIANATVEDPGSVQFNTAGTYTVSFTVADALGLADPTPATRTVTVQAPAMTVIPRTGWAVSYVDSQETSAILTAGSTGHATNSIDGNKYTMWHTDIDNTRPPTPHHILIDLKSSYSIGGFRYLPRQDAYERGRIAEFEFLVSADGSNWGTPVAVGRFPNTENEKQVLFTPKTGRFIKLRGLNEVNGQPYISAAELNFLAVATGGNAAPNGTISAPSDNVVIPVGGSLQLAGSGSDSDGHTPLSYRWTFGPGSGVPDNYAANPGWVRFETPGTYTVSLTVGDANGLADATPATRTITVQSGQPIARSNWTVRYVDRQDGSNVATNAFDGNASTFWQTPASGAPVPHEVQIDMGAVYSINGFTYLPRQDNVWDGRIGAYEFYTSLDGTNWGEPATAGAFPNDGNKKEGFFVTTQARYIRLRALTEVNGKQVTNMAELEVLAAPAVTPYVVLLTPRTYSYQNSTDLYALADAKLAAGQGVRFRLDGGGTTDVYSVPFEAMFTGVSRGEHVVDAQVIDAAGVAVGGAATRDQASTVGIGDYYVAVGDSITYGFGDDIVGDNVSAEGRNATAGFTPILQNLLTAARGRPVAVYNEGLPGEDTVSGASRILSVLQAHPEAQAFLLLYGANDAPQARPSGLGLNPGSNGYSGSYKDYMQRMIDAIRAAGKQVMIAKCTPITPLNGSTNQRILSYNQVIDELVADPDNGITVAPPDFYSFFAPRTSTHYIPDPYHPNGLGFQAMADMWFDALTP